MTGNGSGGGWAGAVEEDEIVDAAFNMTLQEIWRVVEHGEGPSDTPSEFFGDHESKIQLLRLHYQGGGTELVRAKWQEYRHQPGWEAFDRQRAIIAASAPDRPLLGVLGILRRLEDARGYAEQVQQQAVELMRDAAQLEPDELMRVTSLLRHLGLGATRIREWQQGVRDMAKRQRRMDDMLSVNQAKQQRDLLDAARLWANRYGEQWAYDSTGGFWRCWVGTHWRAEDRRSGALDRQAAALLRELGITITGNGKLDGLIRLAAASCDRMFVPRPDRVNFANGTLDLRTTTLQPHALADDLTYCLPYQYAPGDYPTITAFLVATMPDRLAQRAYMAHIGLALRGDTGLHTALLLIGPRRSGKSTLLALANAACGADNPWTFAGPSLFSRELEGKRSRAEWRGRRLVGIDELPVEALRDEGLFKTMTAHGGVEMRGIGRDERTDNRWLSKLMMTTNDMPRYRDPSGALTERLIVLDCPNYRPKDQRTPNLLDALLPELAPFVVACLAEARAIFQLGYYPESELMQRRRMGIATNGDPLKAFVVAACVCEADAWIETAALYQAYERYAGEHPHRLISSARFTGELRQRYPELTPKASYIDNPATGRKDKKARGISGLRLRTEADGIVEE